ncbi:hypothetical protein [Actinoplanes sp. NPDC049316]|uniref:hypothetical protein n=1 Tax=Actinoplanes sp. NPDC049316 TaxID=3154727 RepID=UPI0034204EBE
MPTNDAPEATDVTSSSAGMAVRVSRLIAIAVSFLSGVTVNVVSDDLGYRWAGVLWIVTALLVGGWLLSRNVPESRAIGWFRWVCCAGALSTAVASLLLPERWVAYLLIAAVAMGCAAALATPADLLAPSTMGMLLTASGVAFCAHGVGDQGTAAAVRSAFGAGVAVAGIALILGRMRLAGSIVTALGAVSFAVAMLFVQLGGSALLLVVVFGAMGASGILIGTALIKRPDNVQEVTQAAIRPTAGSLALLYLALGAVALHDKRILLAIADIGGALVVATAMVRSYVRPDSDIFSALLALGPALVVDGAETAMRGQQLSGVVECVGGVVAVAILAVRLRGIGATLWRYAMDSPIGDAQASPAPSDGDG